MYTLLPTARSTLLSLDNSWWPQKRAVYGDPFNLGFRPDTLKSPRSLTWKGAVERAPEPRFLASSCATPPPAPCGRLGSSIQRQGFGIQTRF